MGYCLLIRRLISGITANKSARYLYPNLRLSIDRITNYFMRDIYSLTTANSSNELARFLLLIDRYTGLRISVFSSKRL